MSITEEQLQQWEADYHAEPNHGDRFLALIAEIRAMRTRAVNTGQMNTSRRDPEPDEGATNTGRGDGLDLDLANLEGAIITRITATGNGVIIDFKLREE